MTQMRSALITTKAEFVGLLGASTDLIGTPVSYGHPGNELTKRAIWIGETSEWEHKYVTIGNSQRLEESFDLVVRILAGEVGQETQESEENALEIFSIASRIVTDTANFTALRTGADGPQLVSIVLTPNKLNPWIVPKEGQAAGINAYLQV